MDSFAMNGIVWNVRSVNHDSHFLYDRTGKMSVATTDPITRTIYVSEELSGIFKKRVIAHELGHACCFSYNLLDEIHACCYPSECIRMEEFLCNFVANYGEMIFSITYKIMGDEALNIVPKYLERLVC